MNPVKKLISWLQGPADQKSIAETQRLREDRDTVRISQNTASSELGMAANLAPTPDVLDPGGADSHR